MHFINSVGAMAPLPPDSNTYDLQYTKGSVTVQCPLVEQPALEGVDQSH